RPSRRSTVFPGEAEGKAPENGLGFCPCLRYRMRSNGGLPFGPLLARFSRRAITPTSLTDPSPSASLLTALHSRGAAVLSKMAREGGRTRPCGLVGQRRCSEPVWRHWGQGRRREEQPARGWHNNNSLSLGIRTRPTALVRGRFGLAGSRGHGNAWGVRTQAD